MTDAVGAAGRLLREHGVSDASVRALGFGGSIAAVSAPAHSLERLRELAPALKRLGFAYVALELGAREDQA